MSLPRPQYKIPVYVTGTLLDEDYLAHLLHTLYRQHCDYSIYSTT